MEKKKKGGEDMGGRIIWGENMEKILGTQNY